MGNPTCPIRWTGLRSHGHVHQKGRGAAAWSGKSTEALSILNHRYERDTEYVADFSFTLPVLRDQHEFLVAIG